MKTKGYLSFVLHAHLPFIYHPEDNSYLEETWLFEAISETYIPLLKAFERLDRDNIEYYITMSLTPPLLSMLDNKILKKRYVKYLKERIELSEKEITRTKDNDRLNKLAKYYYNRYSDDLDYFLNELNTDIIAKFKHFQDNSGLEIITCGATHGYFPILILNEKAVKAQIKVGVDTYKKYFGKSPKGIWLPECGYVPEADKYLKEFGINYIITETHGILYANPKPLYSTLAPIASPEGIVAFGRDLESSVQVWSSITGYPGDFSYRDFYKDIGYEADYEYVKPYLAKNGARVHTGIKYHKITGKTLDKDIYSVEDAKRTAENQAQHFLESRTKQINDSYKLTHNPPIILCPYDAELYGHWWYEGPYWLETLFRKIHYQNEFKTITPSKYLEMYPEMQISTPNRSSWGANGYSEVWINQSNDYAHKHLLTLADRMTLIANMNKDLDVKEDKIRIRALNQMARELLLLQSSDWLFIITNNTMVEYAHKRIKLHTGRFNALYEMTLNNDINEDYLKDLEEKDNIFPDIDYLVYAD